MHYLIADLCPSTDEQLNMLLEEDEGQTQAGGHAGGQAGGQGLAGEQGSVKPLLDKHGTALKTTSFSTDDYQPLCSKEICSPVASLYVNTSKRCISKS